MLPHERLLAILRCPACASTGGNLPLQASAHALACARCGTYYPRRAGVPDLAGPIDAPSFPSTQWAMEFGPLVAVYERYWRPWITRPFSDAGWEMRTAVNRLALAPGLDVLDLACGPGNFTRCIATQVPGGLVVGADLSWPMLRRGARELAGGRHPAVALARVDVTRWPFAADSFDRVHCAGALHLFPGHAQVFRNIHDVLRPGGLFVGATYCRGGGAWKQRVQRHVSRTHGFHWFSPAELQGLAVEAGFADWEQFTLRDGIVFRVRKSR